MRFSLLLVKAALLICLVLPVFSPKVSASTEGVADSSVMQPLQATTVQEEAEKYIGRYLRQYHFRKIPVNDSLSREVLARYLDELDKSRSYFLQDDIDDFRRKYDKSIDDQFLAGSAEAGFAVYNRFLELARKKLDYSLTLLDTAEFDFTRKESYALNRDEGSWPADMEELYDLWRKEVKYQLLTLQHSGEAPDSSVQVLRKRYSNRLSVLQQQNAEDAFRIYANVLTTSFDPHTNYLSPMDFENFQIDMSRSLEGIGAKLQLENEYTVVNEVIPGGPAFKEGTLKKGDRIIGVGQGESGQIQDIVGWRINDVVHLIRGNKGSTVRLRILPVSQGGQGPPRLIRIVRDEVTLEEQAAKKSLLEKNGARIGVVTLPSFYLDFEGQKQNKPDFKSTSRDVARIVEELKAEGIDGLILDLRNNGGGALDEAVKLTGLFIPEGPVVQIRNSQGGRMVLADEDPSVLYDGPLVVLVNRFSASASEIFAAAIQDYGRGIVIGGRTFGKGTVQSIMSIKRPFNFFYKSEDLGQLKLTVAKFYRISGESTQHLGVTPDFVFPSVIDSEVVGEDTYSSSLPWDKIAPADYRTLSYMDNAGVETLRQDFLAGLASDSLYADYIGELTMLKEFRKRDAVSLNSVEFSNAMESIKETGETEDDNTETDLLLQHSASVAAGMAQAWPVRAAAGVVQ